MSYNSQLNKTRDNGSRRQRIWEIIRDETMMMNHFLSFCRMAQSIFVQTVDHAGRSSTCTIKLGVPSQPLSSGHQSPSISWYVVDSLRTTRQKKLHVLSSYSVCLRFVSRRKEDHATHGRSNWNSFCASTGDPPVHFGSAIGTRVDQSHRTTSGSLIQGKHDLMYPWIGSSGEAKPALQSCLRFESQWIEKKLLARHRCWDEASDVWHPLGRSQTRRMEASSALSSSCMLVGHCSRHAHFSAVVGHHALHRVSFEIMNVYAWDQVCWAVVSDGNLAIVFWGNNDFGPVSARTAK